VSTIGAEVLMRARDAVRKELVSVAPDTSIADVAVVMNERVVGAVMVVNVGAVAGIVTDRDLVVRGLAAGVPPDARVDSVMTPDVVVLDADSDVREALPIFRTHGFRRLPLVDRGQLVGMLTVDDLLIDFVSDLADIVRPITGEVVFGFAERTMTPQERG
jgi:CBS domain-containing protein